MGPLRNLLPSGDTARVGEITGTTRLPSTMEDATSKTNTVRVAACRFTPMISFPSCDACRRLFAGQVHDAVGRRQGGRDRRGRRHRYRLRLSGERIVGNQHFGPGAGADGGDQAPCR